MPKRKRLWKHQVPVVEFFSIINIHYVHSNKDFKVFGWMLLSSFKHCFSKESHLFVLVHSGVCLAPFVERCPVGLPGAPGASGQQPAPQLPEPSGASKHKGIHSPLLVTHLAQSSHFQVFFMRSDFHLHFLGSVNGK